MHGFVIIFEGYVPGVLSLSLDILKMWVGTL
jgi:hypothetical protein